MNKKQARVRRARKTRVRIAEQRANRLVVNRSNCHIYAQIIAPSGEKVLASASTVEAEVRKTIVGSGFLDAQGLPLRAPAQRRYHTGGEERRHVDPGSWVLTVPSAGTSEPLRVTFDRPLDHGLLARCLHVSGPDGRLVDGTPSTGRGEQSWQLVPPQTWAAGSHQLIVDPVLEDLAGNSVSRVFDRDLDRREDQPRQARPRHRRLPSALILLKLLRCLLELLR